MSKIYVFSMPKTRVPVLDSVNCSNIQTVISVQVIKKWIIFFYL